MSQWHLDGVSTALDDSDHAQHNSTLAVQYVKHSFELSCGWSFMMGSFKQILLLAVLGVTGDAVCSAWMCWPLLACLQGLAYHSASASHMCMFALIVCHDRTHSMYSLLHEFRAPASVLGIN